MSFKSNEWYDILNKIDAFIKLDDSINKITTLISKNIWKESKIEHQIDKEKLMEKFNELIKLSDKLKKQIKKQIDNFYFKEKLNFLEIEHWFRENECPCYLVAEHIDSLDGSEIINSDNFKVEFKTELLITKDFNEYLKYFNIQKSTKKEQDDMIKLNLNLLEKAGIFIITNKQTAKNNLSEIYEKYLTNDDDLNDY